MYKKYEIKFDRISNLKFEDNVQKYDVVVLTNDPEVEGEYHPHHSSCTIRGFEAPIDQVLSEEFVEGQIVARTGYTSTL